MAEILREHAPLDAGVVALLGTLLADVFDEDVEIAAGLPYASRLAQSGDAAPDLLGPASAEPKGSTVEPAAAVGRFLYEALSGRALEAETATAATLARLAPWVDPELAAIIAHAASARAKGSLSLAQLKRELSPFASDARELSALVTSTPHDPRLRPNGSDPEASDAAWIGRAVGRYRIVERIGRGAMGAVYGAVAQDGAEVAIKVLRTELADKPALRRFVREARWAARIESPHVTRVIEVLGDDAQPILVLERLRGRDLASVFANEGALQAQPAARIIADACLGLEAAHRVGLVHRDLKPSNVFLHEAADGAIVTKICDFGVAKLDAVLGEQDTALTKDGGLLGTPAYMAPEQARDPSSVDRRADIWSLGATLYELLSGRRLWQGAGTVGEVLAALATREVQPLVKVAPWVSPALAEVVQACLCRDPAERIASAGALRERLEPFASDAPLCTSDVRVEETAATPQREIEPAETRAAPAYPNAEPRSWPRRAALGGLLTALLAGSIWLALRGREPADQPSPTAVVTATCPGAEACTQELGEPARCGAAGTCAALGSAECVVDADKAAIASDRTLWLGAMFPSDHEDAYTASFGRGAANAVSLAMHEITSVAGGIPASEGGPLPLGLVVCRDAKDPGAAAKHLVENVRAPVVIGFGSGKSVVELSSTLFLKNDVLTIASINSSALLSAIQHAPGQPRLVFRTAANTATRAAALAKLIPAALEPRLRARRGARAGDIRIGLVARHTSAGIAFSEALGQRLSFNGKTVPENGAAFREVRLVGDDEASMKPGLAVSALLSTKPDLVIVQDTSDVVVGRIIVPLEDQWDVASAPRPVYLLTGSIEAEAVGELLVRHPTVGSRLLGLTPPWQTPANASFTRAYNAAFREQLSEAESPGAPYDSVYLVAYAASIASDPTSGASVAQAIGRLVPPGIPTPVGPTSWLEGTARLAQGTQLDLYGTFSRLDFDLATGESPSDYAIVCGRLASGSLAVDAAGVVYDAGKDAVVGELRCGVPD